MNTEEEKNQLSDFFRELKYREDPTHPLTEEERLSGAVKPLLCWYGENARDLPWRRQPSPYRVWVSEIMLQQTRVEAVKPYFTRFMEAYPEISDLARAEEEQLLKLWEGLGYYSRARNMKKAAQAAVEQYDGCLPADFEKLKKLPGIGPYTAGAIASIAYQIAVPAVDGNVLRVITRLLADAADIARPDVKKQVEQKLKKVIPEDCPGEFNQALMELGALVCVPNGSPKCGDCPWEGLCLANRKGLTGEIPFKSPKKARRTENRTVFLIQSEGKTGVRKRGEQGLLAGLYEFPSLEGKLEKDQVRELLENCLGVNGTGKKDENRYRSKRDISGRNPVNVVNGAYDRNNIIGGKDEDGETQIIERLPEAKHVFTHVEWHMTGWRLNIPVSDWDKLDTLFGPLIPADQRQLETVYAIPSAYKKYYELIH